MKARSYRSNKFRAVAVDTPMFTATEDNRPIDSGPIFSQPMATFTLNLIILIAL
ncbi:hypothetical protein CCP3SC5AM1_3160001 [Gammaproteobacteria bacterium]